MNVVYPIAFFLLVPTFLVLLYVFFRSRRSLKFIERNSHPSRRHGLTILNQKTHLLYFVIYFILSSLLVYAITSPYRSGTVTSSQLSGRVLIFLDASLSMLAEDVREEKGDVAYYTRLSLAKILAERLVDALVNDSKSGKRSYRIGLYSFAGDVITHCPPTDDIEVVSSLMKSYDYTMTYTNTGSSIANVLKSIRSQLAYLDTDESIQVVLMGDGEIPEGYENDYDDDLKALNAAGVTIHTVAIGTKDGVRLTLYNPSDLVKNKGRNAKPYGTVTTKRVDKHYKRIAGKTGGIFDSVDVSTLGGKIIDNIADELIDGVHSATKKEDIAARVDRSPFWLGVFLFFFFIELYGVPLLRIYLVRGRAGFILALISLFVLGAGCDRLTSHWYNEKGIMLESLGSELAKDEYERAKLYGGGESVAIANLAGVIEKEGDRNQAHKLFEESIRIESDRPSVHYKDGLLLVDWALSEAKECRLKRANELIDVARTRFQSTIEIEKSHSRLRRWYDQYLLNEVEVAPLAGEALSKFAGFISEIDQAKETCPPESQDQGNGDNQDDDQNENKDQNGGDDNQDQDENKKNQNQNSNNQNQNDPADPNQSNQNDPNQNKDPNQKDQNDPKEGTEGDSDSNLNQNRDHGASGNVSDTRTAERRLTNRLEHLRNKKTGKFSQTKGLQQDGDLPTEEPLKVEEGQGGPVIWW